LTLIYQLLYSRGNKGEKMQNTAHNRNKVKRDGHYITVIEDVFRKILTLTSFSIVALFLAIVFVDKLSRVGFLRSELVSPLPDTVVFAKEIPVQVEIEVFKPSIDSIINHYAAEYNVNADEMRCTIKNESGFRKEAKNGTSTASGLGQYVVRTWKHWRKQMGQSTDPDLRFDAEESIETMAWAFSKGYQPHWEAWKTHCKGNY
jgi:hypothetical protein